MYICNVQRNNDMIKNKKNLVEGKQKCAEAKIGSEISCPSCGTKFVKKSYNSVFCKSKGKTVCKDHYWNNVDECKRNNTTRISPANARYYSNVILEKEARKRGFPDYESMKETELDIDGGWDDHACTVGICDLCDLRYDYCRCGEGVNEF